MEFFKIGKLDFTFIREISVERSHILDALLTEVVWKKLSRVNQINYTDIVLAVEVQSKFDLSTASTNNHLVFDSLLGFTRNYITSSQFS